MTSIRANSRIDVEKSLLSLNRPPEPINIPFDYQYQHVKFTKLVEGRPVLYADKEKQPPTKPEQDQCMEVTLVATREGDGAAAKFTLPAGKGCVRFTAPLNGRSRNIDVLLPKGYYVENVGKNHFRLGDIVGLGHKNQFRWQIMNRDRWN